MNQVATEYDEYREQGRIWGLVPRERIKAIRFPRVPVDIVQRYSALDDLTTTVSDILDSFGIVGAVPGSFLKPLGPGQRTVGPAVTIRNLAERKTPTQGYYDKDVIRMSTRDIYYLAEEGDVLVTDTGGDLSISNMGVQSCTVAQTRGLAGSIVNGAIRDAGGIRDLGYPVWSCGVTPMTGKFRIEAIEMNGPVSVQGVRVEPGDLMVADDSGVCVVPADRVLDVLTAAERISEEERVMADLIRRDVPIDELRQLFRKRYS